MMKLDYEDGDNDLKLDVKLFTVMFWISLAGLAIILTLMFGMHESISEDSVLVILASVILCTIVCYIAVRRIELVKQELQRRHDERKRRRIPK